MAAEFTQDTILDFLRQRGGRAKSCELTEHFSAAFPEEPPRRAAVRDSFRSCVNSVAFVKKDGGGVKYVCLKKKFRQSPGTDTSPKGASDDDVRRQTLPGSGYGSDGGPVPRLVPAPSASEQEQRCRQCARLGADGGSGEMGNRGSVRPEQREQVGRGPDIPQIAVVEASPLPTEEDSFSLPKPAGADRIDPGPGEPLREPQPSHVTGDQGCRGPQQKFFEDESDDRSLSGSEDNGTPRGSRRHFIQVMMNSSPQVRRGVGLHLSSRSDSDSASLASCSVEDERTPVTLDIVEHEWMMCASDGEWDSLQRLLSVEPNLILRKDFVSGFTCLHWAAKHGRTELIALIINFAKQNDVPISVDVRSNTGYTPLHIAAMHSHMEVVKLLVGAYNADVEVRDYSGRKACQYLTSNASVDIQDIIGAYDHSESQDPSKHGGRWRFSKVLQSNLKPAWMLKSDESVDEEGRPRGVILRRRSSLSGMKPKLQRLRMRTSQIVHSVSFRERDELDRSQDGSFRSRRKTHLFG